jgi:hypothetical protein
MSNATRILVAMDDFQHSHAVLDFVAELAGCSDAFTVCLFHAAGPFPPQLLESPGGESGREEERIEQRQVRQQDSWLENIRSSVEAQFATAKQRLIKANVAAVNIETHLFLLNQRSDLVPEMIRIAREKHCGTIVVGRNSYSWLREQFHTHVSESLIEETPDLAICIISEPGHGKA